MSIDKDDRPERARRLAKQDITVPVIAERLGVTRRTVWRWIHWEKVDANRRLELPAL